MRLGFYKGKRVLITGHTGFKGTWLSRILINAGADVTGYSLNAPTDPNLFVLSGNESRMKSVIADIRDFDRLLDIFRETRPEIVFHLAAQPIVRNSYKNPRYTYETNVMGTVNIMECVRLTDCAKSIVNVTTDKVYRNNEWEWGYREDDTLDGYDPYSNSKSCSELVTDCYKNSFFSDGRVAVSTARAGNVIGGGDFADDRIVPDCIRAMKEKRPIIVRNPYSTRPYQHVLEPLAVYISIAEAQHGDLSLAGSYNVGPDEQDCLTTGELVDLFCKCWGEGADWVDKSEKNAPHEAGFLKLDCSRVKKVFGWSPRWHIDECMDRVCRFGKMWIAGESVDKEMDLEIDEFFS